MEDGDDLKNTVDTIYSTAQRAAEAIRSKMSEEGLNFDPKFGIICGSGLGHIADIFDFALDIPYTDIPGLPTTTQVVGHEYFVKVGNISGKKTICFQGRFHYYEGHPMWKVTLPVRIMRLLGVETVFITNVCGGVNPSYSAGDIMVIKDHINITGCNPLIGMNDYRWGTRFPDLSFTYDADLRYLCTKAFEKHDLKKLHREGVYFMLTGPSYETKAETKMIHIVGGDAVGMSTVPEVIVAGHCGMKVCGLSLIVTTIDFNNYAHHEGGFDHEMVVAAGMRGGKNMALIIRHVISQLK